MTLSYTLTAFPTKGLLRYDTGTDYPTTVLANSPTAYYRLNDSSGTNVVDSAASPHDGTMTGTPTFSQAGAILRDTDDAIQFGTTSTASARFSIPTAAFSPVGGSFTVEAWFKIGTNPAGKSYIWTGHDGTTVLYVAVTPAGRFEVSYNGTLYDTGANVITFGAWWQHAAIVYDATADTIAWYLNGSQTGTVATGVTTHTYGSMTTANLVAGTYLIGAASAFYGQLDEVGLYTTALSGANVSEHYNIGLGGHLVLANVAQSTADWTYMPTTRNSTYDTFAYKISDSVTGLDSVPQHVSIYLA